MWKFRGLDPATVWRGPGSQGPVSPEPWPARVDAFLTACAMHAGQRERDLLDVVRGISDAAAAMKG